MSPDYLRGLAKLISACERLVVFGGNVTGSMYRLVK